MRKDFNVVCFDKTNLFFYFPHSLPQSCRKRERNKGFLPNQKTFNFFAKKDKVFV